MSPSSTPNASRSSRHPVEMAALANWSSRTSRCDRYTALVPVSSSEASRKTRSSPTFVSRSAIFGARSSAASSGDEPARAVEQPDADQLAHRVDQPGPAHSGRHGVADHLQVKAVVVDLDHLDRTRRSAHATADRRGLERRPGRRRSCQHPLAVTENDFAVRADVDEQPEPLVTIHPGGQDPGDDVSADVCAERREDRRPRLRVDANPQVARRQSRYSLDARMNGATPSGSGSIPSASCTIVAFPASATS